MDALICCRHSEYDSATGDLTAPGREAAGRLAPPLRLYCNSGRVMVRCSPAPRAKQTAAILVSGMSGVTAQCHPALGELAGDDQILRLVDELADSCDTLILVGHINLGQYSPGVYRVHRLGESNVIKGVDYAEAIVLICATGACIRIP